MINNLRWMVAGFLLTIFSDCADQAKSQQAPPPVSNNSAKIQIALLLDTSNSMDGLIEQAKSQLWNIVNELAKAKCDDEIPILQIALYEYGNDNLPVSEGYIRLVTPLTSDLDEISKDLFELRTNGGSEFCGEVIQTALKQLDWSKSVNNLQLIYIAGNEPFTQGWVNYNSACLLAREKNVIVNTIHCGDFQTGINTAWKNGADLTGGSYASIEQNRKTVYIESPYDNRIAELNKLLNETYIPYGRLGQERKELQEQQDNNSRQYGSVNYVKRIVSKSSHVYENKSWDLVDAAKEDDFDINKLEKTNLPPEMQSMNDEEQNQYIAERAVQRQQLSAEIQKLNQQRTEYITKNSALAKSDQMLDEAILSALRQQAVALNFTLE